MPWVVGFIGYVITWLIYDRENLNVVNRADVAQQDFLAFLVLGIVVTAVFFGSFTYKHRQMSKLQRFQKSFDWGGATIALLSVALYFLGW